VSGGASAGGDGSGGAGSEDAAVAPDAPMSDAVGRPADGPPPATFLHVVGNSLFDAQGKPARFTGVNWFGLETSNEAPHGTWARDYRSMLKQMRDLGFNSLRLPWSNAIMRPDAKAQSVTTIGKDPYDGTDPMNGPLAGKTPLEMMDLVIAAAGDVGLRIILDDHSREPDAYDKEELWYSAKTPESLWISDWVSLAKRYSGNPTVVAFDLDNEPHGASTWGTGGPNDWNKAAERCGNAILAANPDVLIIVEGVSIVGTDVYWWGGNLSAVRTAPIVLSKPDKLVYSAHEYGPEVHDQTWFTDATFPANLAAVWDQHFNFIMKQGIGHLLLGEFGIKDRTADSGKSGQWFDTLLKTVGSTYSWTFWCWNPNSGDTEGILQTDWLTPQQWKMDALKPYLAPMIGR
jgi:aryl-phospho-beta-D-glucosidase BglC (GH1 family)